MKEYNKLSMEYTLTEIANKIFNAKNEPNTLYDLYIVTATMYSKYSDTFKDLEIEKAVFWNTKTVDANGVIREKPLSDKAVEMLWRTGDKGQEYLKQKYILKGLEKLMSAVNSALYHSNVEAKNQY